MSSFQTSPIARLAGCCQIRGCLTTCLRTSCEAAFSKAGFGLERCPVYPSHLFCVFLESDPEFCRTLWGSIGWSVGACQGAALAAKDAGVDRRTVLFVGDGSYQLTAQEVSTIVRHGLRVTLFCICNEGYTIERFIHGAEAEYNDIAPWRFRDTPAAFGASAKQVSTHVVRTKAELDRLLRDRDFNEARNLQFVELHVPKMDAPRPLVMVANAAAKNNSRA